MGGRRQSDKLYPLLETSNFIFKKRLNEVQVNVCTENLIQHMDDPVCFSFLHSF